ATTGPSPSARSSPVPAMNARILAERLGSITGIAVAADGSLYVVAFDDQKIVHLDASGGILGSWGRPGAGPGEFGHPAGIAVGPDGAIFVADHDNDRIQRFSAAGEYLGAFGTPGTGRGELSHPDAIAVDRAGN